MLGIAFQHICFFLFYIKIVKFNNKRAQMMVSILTVVTKWQLSLDYCGEHVAKSLSPLLEYGI